jgi:hypothetical protein
MKLKLSLILTALLPGLGHTLTREGLLGIGDTPSAHTLTSGQMTLGFSAGAHNDATSIQDGIFLLDRPSELTPDTMVISDLQSYYLSANLVMGLGDHVDVGFSIPWYGDVTSDTRAEELSGHGFGDPSLFTKVSVAGSNLWVMDAALIGSLHLPSNSSKGFLAKDPGFLNLDPGETNTRLHSANAVWGQIGMVATLDLQRLPTPLPFALHLGGGYRFLPNATAGSGIQSQVALQWLASPNLGFFVAVLSQTRDSLYTQITQWQNEYATLSGGINIHDNDGFLLDLGFHLGQGKSPYTKAAVPVPDGEYRYQVRSQPDLSFSLQFAWTFELWTPTSSKHNPLGAED